MAESLLVRKGGGGGLEIESFTVNQIAEGTITKGDFVKVFGGNRGNAIPGTVTETFINEVAYETNHIGIYYGNNQVAVLQQTSDNFVRILMYEINQDKTFTLLFQTKMTNIPTNNTNPLHSVEMIDNKYLIFGAGNTSGSKIYNVRIDESSFTLINSVTVSSFPSNMGIYIKKVNDLKTANAGIETWFEGAMVDSGGTGRFYGIRFKFSRSSNQLDNFQRDFISNEAPSPSTVIRYLKINKLSYSYNNIMARTNSTIWHGHFRYYLQEDSAIATPGTYPVDTFTYDFLGVAPYTINTVVVNGTNTTSLGTNSNLSIKLFNPFTTQSNNLTSWTSISSQGLGTPGQVVMEAPPQAYTINEKTIFVRVQQSSNCRFYLIRPLENVSTRFNMEFVDLGTFTKTFSNFSHSYIRLPNNDFILLSSTISTPRTYFHYVSVNRVAKTNNYNDADGIALENGTNTNQVKVQFFK